MKIGAEAVKSISDRLVEVNTDHATHCFNSAEEVVAAVSSAMKRLSILPQPIRAGAKIIVYSGKSSDSPSQRGWVVRNVVHATASATGFVITSINRETFMMSDSVDPVISVTIAQRAEIMRQSVAGLYSLPSA